MTFEERNCFEKTSSILIKTISTDKLEVHLGFLKINNTYEVIVPLHIPDHTPSNISWIPDVSKQEFEIVKVQQKKFCKAWHDLYKPLQIT